MYMHLFFLSRRSKIDQVLIKFHGPYIVKEPEYSSERLSSKKKIRQIIHYDNLPYDGMVNIQL